MYTTKIWDTIKSISKVDKQAIAKLGIAFGLTYNIISNINGSISLSLAWYIASTKVRGVKIETLVYSLLRRHRFSHNDLHLFSLTPFA